MSTIAIKACNHSDHLFNHPLCKSLPIERKVANVAFHVFTLCIPLAIYHAISYCHSKITHYRRLRHLECQDEVIVPKASTQGCLQQNVLARRADSLYSSTAPVATNSFSDKTAEDRDEVTDPNMSAQGCLQQDVLARRDNGLISTTLFVETDSDPEKAVNTAPSLDDIKSIEATSKKKKFRYVDHPQRSFDSPFELQKSISLLNKTRKIEVDMYDEGRVEQVTGNPVFLYTDYLGPCVATIGRCKLSDSSMLIGVTHLYPENRDYNAKLSAKVDSVLKVNEIGLKYLNKEKIIKKGQFKPQKFIDLVDKFLSHPSYKGEEIELFFAGGNGDLFDAFWRELTAEYAKSIPNLTVIGTYFNPYQATHEIQERIRSENLKMSFMAGITEQGSILLRKSHDVEFNFSSI